MISIQKSAFCLWIGQVAPSFIPCDYVVKEFVVYQPYRWGHRKCSVVFLFVRMSTSEIPNVDRLSACSTHHEEFSENFLQKFQPLKQFDPHISFCHFLTISRTLLTCASLVDVDGRPLGGSSSKLSRPSWKRLYKPCTWDILLALSPYDCCKMVNVSTGDFCSQTQNLIFVSCSVTVIFNCDANSRILKKQKTAVKPLEFMKWRNYFCDDVVSGGCQLMKQISLVQQFL
jgi:hypothetical protein